jgi:hypothetical protein
MELQMIRLMTCMGEPHALLTCNVSFFFLLPWWQRLQKNTGEDQRLKAQHD